MTMSAAPNVGKRAKNGRSSVTQIPGVTLAESLRQQLEGAIAAGHLEPGSRLDEQEIAQRFGVSRTPVREAFRLMAANNLVELRGRQGATVRAIKAEALVEMFQVMAELEGLCARLAARRVSQAWGSKISEIHKRLVATGEIGDIDVFYDVNQEFHEAIMQAILAHDSERAHSTMRDHVNLLGDNLLDFLAAFK